MVLIDAGSFDNFNVGATGAAPDEYLSDNEVITFLTSSGQDLKSWDTDKDSKISRIEYANRATSLSVKKALNAADGSSGLVAKHQGSQLFAPGELYKDGKDTRSRPSYELQTNFEVNDFDRIDANENNKITAAEWKSAGLDEKLFKAIAGNDNSLSRGDWDGYVANQQSAQGQPINPNLKAKTSISAADFDKYNKADASGNKDSEISGNELMSFLSETGEKLNKWDANRDGKITVSEFMSGSQTMTVETAVYNNDVAKTLGSRYGKPAFTQDDFKIIDADNDQQITRSEWMTTGIEMSIFDMIGKSKNVSINEWNTFLLSDKNAKYYPDNLVSSEMSLGGKIFTGFIPQQADMLKKT